MKKEIASYLSDKSLIIPHKLRMRRTDFRSQKTCSQLIMLYDYFTSQNPSVNFVVYPDCAEHPLYARPLISQNSPTLVFAAVISDDSFTEDLQILQTMISKSEENGRIKILTVSEDGIKFLRETVQLSETQTEQVEYDIVDIL